MRNLLLLLCLFANSVFAQIPEVYTQKAKDNQVWEDPQWERILHYARNIIGVRQGQISDANFWLSSNGRTNPEAELLETLKALSAPAFDYKENDHPICRFPGRKRWLQAKLGIPDEFFPKARCPLYQTYIDRLEADSVSIVFSSYYTNSPGSAFGHTLFRIAKKKASKGQNSELLDHGIGYAANVGEVDPLRYMIYGVFGGFSGSFTNVPFYYKVREYGDFENRDLWTYDLNLSPEERDLLVDHIWEVGDIHFNYYFFTQNCAYHMLSVLDAAAPRLNLIDNMPLWSIPTDSIKVLFTQKNLVKAISFRPSLRKNFLARHEELSENDALAFDNYISTLDLKEIRHLEKESQRKILDTALDFYDFKYPKILSQENSQEAHEKDKILSSRASLLTSSPPLHIPIKEAEKPENGHGSARFSLALSSTKYADHQYTLIEPQLRFAMHDLMDPAIGYPQWSQLEFFNFKASYDPKEKHFKMNEFWFFAVTTAQPVTKFEKHLTWQARLGQKSSLGDYNDPAYGTQLAGGYSWLLDPNHDLLLMTLLAGEVFYNQQFPKQWEIAVGPKLSLLARANDKIAFQVAYRYLTHAYKGFENINLVEAQARYSLNKESAMFLESSEYLAPTIPWRDVKLGLHYYF